MKSFTEYQWFNTKKKQEYMNITSIIENILHKSEVQEVWYWYRYAHHCQGIRE